MTSPESAALDVSQLADAMRSHGLDVVGRLHLSRVGFGQSNLTYAAVDEREHRWIVRRPPLGDLLASAHDVVREYRILAALDGSGVPVPGMNCLLHRGVVADVPALVMEYVDGHVIDGFESLGQLSSAVRTAFISQMSSVLASIHAVDVVAVGLDGLASHGAYAPRQLKRWAAQWSQSRTRDLPMLDVLTDVLTRKAPPQVRLSLIHGDFSPRNLIVDPSQGVIQAVLDWELSTLGEPLADVGTVLAYWTLAEMVEAKAGRGLSDTGDREAFVQSYLELSSSPSGHVEYWHALGLWKLAIITEGVIKRASDEPGNATVMGAPDPSDVEKVVDLALEIVDGVGFVGFGAVE